MNLQDSYEFCQSPDYLQASFLDHKSLVLGEVKGASSFEIHDSQKQLNNIRIISMLFIIDIYEKNWFLKFFFLVVIDRV